MIDTRLPLTDIHRHLDGNIRAQTILDLGRQFNLTLPAETLETLIPHVQVTSNEPDLVSFLSKLDWGVKMLASVDACRRVAFENIEDAARNGLHYVELRFSPGYMAMTHNLPVAGVVEAVIEGVREGCKTFDVQARLIGIMSRTFGEAACLQELKHYWRIATRSPPLTWPVTSWASRAACSCLISTAHVMQDGILPFMRGKPLGRKASGRPFVSWVRNVLVTA